MQKKYLAGAVWAALTVLTSVTPAAYAEETNKTVNAVTSYNFNVASGDLESVIREISLQAKATISLDSGNDSDKVVPGVKGQMTLKEALTQVLAGTGWSLQEGQNNTFFILRDDMRVVVTARREDFARTDSSLLTRTDTPLRQTPGTIDSVTEEVLDSQNAMSVGDALRNVPGVIFSVGGTSQAYIDGNSTGGVTFTNGLRNSTMLQNLPITDIEAIEVLKGPASILTGTQVAGGVINFVPKRAYGNRKMEVGVGVGSGGERITTADLGGKLSEEYGLSGRLNLLYQDADELPNGGNSPYSHVVNPILGWRGDDFSVDASLQFNKTRTAFLDIAQYDPSTKKFLRYGDRINPDSNTTVESTTASIGFEKDLIDSDSLLLQWRGRAQYQTVDRDQQFQTPMVYDLYGLGTPVLNFLAYGKDEIYAGYSDLYAKFDVGSTSHQLILAYDGRHREYEGSNIYPSIVYTQGQTLDIGKVPRSAPRGVGLERENGIVLQDQMTIGRFHALLGLRQSWFRNRLYDVDLFTQTRNDEASKQQSEKFLPNGGLVYDFTDNISGYVSYSTDFKPVQPQYTSVGGGMLAPTEQERYETGVKMGLLDDKFTVNMSVFTAKTKNDVRMDVDNPGYYMSVPGSKSKGAEISASGSVTPSLKVLGGVSYTKVEDEDQPYSSTPEYVANLWAIQTFKVASHDLDAGFGVYYNSDFYAVDPIQGSYSKVDRDYLDMKFSLGYTVGDTKINATIDNLLNRDNYMPSGSLSQINVAAPRTFRVMLTHNF